MNFISESEIYSSVRVFHFVYITLQLFTKFHILIFWQSLGSVLIKIILVTLSYSILEPKVESWEILYSSWGRLTRRRRHLYSSGAWCQLSSSFQGIMLSSTFANISNINKYNSLGWKHIFWNWNWARNFEYFCMAPTLCILKYKLLLLGAPDPTSPAWLITSI